MSGPTPGAAYGTTSYRAGSGGVDWQERGACRQYNPELWYVTGRDDASQADKAEAKRICGGCPVLLECRRHALDNREPHGIWGGLDEDEREEVYAGARKGPRRPPNSSAAWKAAQKAANDARRAHAAQDRAALVADIEHLAGAGADISAAARAAGRSIEAPRARPAACEAARPARPAQEGVLTPRVSVVPVVDRRARTATAGRL